MFPKEHDPVGEENTVTTFKRSADDKTITRQQRMQKDIDAWNKTQLKPKISVKMNPDFLLTRKARKKSKKGWKMSASKMQIAELGSELRCIIWSAS